MAEVPDTVDDAIEELSDTPTTDEVFFKTLPFQGREIASAAVSMAAAGGGGGDPFNGGTITDELSVEPAHDTGSGTLNAYAKGDDFPTRLMTLGTYDNDVTARIVWSFEENGTAQLGPIPTSGAGSGINAEGEWTMRVPEDAGDVNVLSIYDQTGGLRVRIDSLGSIQQFLAADGVLQVFNSSFGEVFRVDENGTVHIKTGTSILADL